MKTTFLILSLFAGTFSCLHSKPKLSFVKLEMASYIDSSIDKGKLVVAKGDSYIGDGYKHNKKNQNLIDRFVEKNKDSLFVKYTQYVIAIYKKSDKTNVDHLKENPGDLDRYSQNNDLIYKYYWVNGKLLVRYKFKNGIIIEPKPDIKVEDIPDSSDKIHKR